MFSLPQTDANVSVKQNPVIDLTENSKTIATLLTSIYPVVSATTEPKTLDEIVDIVVAAKKYDMAAVSHLLDQTFTKLEVVLDDPIVAFCSAYSLELGLTARAAAKASLKCRMNLDSIGDKLEYINGPAFHKLYKFHRACAAAAAQVVSGKHLTWTTPSHGTWWAFANISCANCARFKYTLPTGPGSSTQITWQASAPYHNFIMRTINVLMEQPCREAVPKYDFLFPSYSETGCSTCRLTLLGLPEFSYFLGEEVERRVSMVDLELPF